MLMVANLREEKTALLKEREEWQKQEAFGMKVIEHLRAQLSYYEKKYPNDRPPFADSDALLEEYDNIRSANNNNNNNFNNNNNTNDNNNGNNNNDNNDNNLNNNDLLSVFANSSSIKVCIKEKEKHYFVVYFDFYFLFFVESVSF